MARKPKKSETTEQIVEEIEAQSGATVSNDSQTTDESISEAESNTETQQPSSLCGGALALERNSQGLTVQDIAKRLRLGVKQVDAIEQDDFGALPESTIVKGFIRNYAKLLKIPSEPLISAYMELKPEKEKQAFAVHSGINMEITEGKQTDKTRYFVYTLLILFAAAMWFFYQNFVQKPSPINPTPEIVEALPEFALPVSEREEDNASINLEMPEQDTAATSGQAVVDAETELLSSQVSDNASESNVEIDVPAAVMPNEQEKTNDLDSGSESASTNTATDAPPPRKTRLEFTATQETWLSVVNTSGKEVYNKILYAGNHEVVDLWQPAEIVVGNAHGATLIVDGKLIDLAPYTRINVARVRLNQ